MAHARCTRCAKNVMKLVKNVKKVLQKCVQKNADKQGKTNIVKAEKAMASKKVMQHIKKPSSKSMKSVKSVKSVIKNIIKNK